VTVLTIVANFDNLTDIFMTHLLMVYRLRATVGPQVRPADAGCSKFNNGIRGFQEGGHGAVFYDDFTGLFHND